MYKPNLRTPYVASTSEGDIWVHPSVGRIPSPPYALLRPYWISGAMCGDKTAGPFLTDMEIQYFLGVALFLEVAIAERARAEGVTLEEPLWY